MAQSELSKDRGYLQLLYKKPLDPRSEERLKVGVRGGHRHPASAVSLTPDPEDQEGRRAL